MRIGEPAATTGNIFVNKTEDRNKCKGMTTVDALPYRADGDTSMVKLKMPLLIVENTNGDPSCGEGHFADYDIGTPALWYKIDGNDRYIKAVIETTDNAHQPFALFRGSDCGKELECIHGHSHTSDNVLTWFAEKGETYYFKVFGNPEADDQLFVLDFMVRQTSLETAVSCC